MSPLPAVPLEVERYVGACLISNQNRQKFYGKQNPSQQQTENQFYGRERYRNFPNRDDVRRCGAGGGGGAVVQHPDGWAGGMPLISYVNHQASRNRRPDLQQNLYRAPPIDDYNNLARLAVHTQGAPLILAKTYNHRKNKLQRNNQTNPKFPDVKTKNGKNNADTVSVTSDESYGSGNSDQCLPRIIKPRKRRKKDRKLPQVAHLPAPDYPTEINPTGFLTFEGARRHHFDFLVPNNESETPRLQHTFDELEDLDDSTSSSATSTATTPTTCQCRYCDPSGQIWDVDTTSYSSFLTPPPTTSTPTFALVEELSRLRLLDAAAVSTRAAKDCDNRRASSASDLEVSTEIVTSLNGLRDLEIKFFTSSTTTTTASSSADGNSSRTCNNKVFAKNSIDIETC